MTNIADYAFANCFALTGIYFQGDAPGEDSTVFTADNGTVYHLPETMNWGPLFGGLPTALWLPTIVGGSSMGSQASQFGFDINWSSGQTIIVEACVDLDNPDWQPLQTNTLGDGLFHFSDPQWTNYSERFYRISTH